MPETAVETSICDICGAEVRDGSLFCYNCGGSVTVDEKAAIEPTIRSKVSSEVKAELSGGSGMTSERQARRRRTYNRGPVEVVWEPRTGISVPFILGSLIFVLVTIVLLISAAYLN